MERMIYYSGQRDWEKEDFNYLNSLLNKMFQYIGKNSEYTEMIERMAPSCMEHTTLAILVAVLKTNQIYDEIIEKFPKFKILDDIKPLNIPLNIFVGETPITKQFPHLFKEYQKMNIII